MKIGFITTSWGLLDQNGNYALGGVGWYRCGLPAYALRDHAGCELVLAADVDITRPHEPVRLYMNQQAHDDCALLVINMWINEAVPKIIEQAHSNGQKVILDMDDWLWALDKDHVAWRVYTKRQEVAGFALQHWERALTMCDAVTCSTPFIYEQLKQFTDKPRYLLRNAIALDMFPHGEIRQDLSCIGWMGGIPWRSGDLEKLRAVVPDFLEKYDLQFMHVGYLPQRGSVSEKMLVPRNRLIEIPGLPIFEYPYAFQFLDIGLVPLKFIDFNKAKSSLKGFEYAAAGVPFVAHATEEYKWFGEGLLCNNKKQFADALELLVDPEARKYYADKAYVRVQQESINVRWQQWYNCYTEVLANNNF